MLFSKLFKALLGLTYVTTAVAVTVTTGGSPSAIIKPYSDVVLQDIVTWDNHSIFVRGERIMIFSGEFHPFRLPVPGLWLDVFQKLKAAGYSAVSFYVHWALLEGKPGSFSAEGIFDFVPFFDAASEAGIYLLARPGPYINAEASGGGFPGWLGRNKAIDRTPAFLPLTANYVQNIGEIIAKAQITNGGPVILLQPENEYSQGTSNILFPDPTYFQGVEDMYRAAGIVVPFYSNDAFPHGFFAPGTGNGSVDIYGFDGYPLGFDCANPTTWPNGDLPTFYLADHQAQSPSTPLTISEFQGGSFDPWGGQGFAKCAELLNEEFERVFYKNNYAIDVTIFNIYMSVGGTNWGNLGHPGGYTSYDYGAIIAEDRTITREKYSELKLQANFFKVSPAYLTAPGGFTANGAFVSTANIATTQLISQGNPTVFYVVRQATFNSLGSTSYKLNVETSLGARSIPELLSELTINGRDSKIHVTDYNVGGVNMLYSTAEVFTWKKYATKTVLVLYGAIGETHETAFVASTFSELQGNGVLIEVQNGTVILNWAVTAARKVIQVGPSLFVYLLNRNDAYDYWVIDLPAALPAGNFTTATPTSIIARAGYLLRTASITGTTLSLTGDVNATTTIEVIGAPSTITALNFNGKALTTTTGVNGAILGTVTFVPPALSIPAMTGLTWKFINSLPEILPTYDDTPWVNANHTTSNNTARPLTTPVSLYGSDYGFSTGNLLTRGHFTANGQETFLAIEIWGGTGYASSIYLNGTLINTFTGNPADGSLAQNFSIPKLTANAHYILTVINDNMGLDEDGTAGADTNKDPRGIVNYQLGGHAATDITWKITGNLGGENFEDPTRGPLNEGGLFAERQGFHLPAPPTSTWATSSPFTGISAPGVGFYASSFTLNFPAGYDVPLSFQFTFTTGANFRIQLYVNGYQFGKFVNNIGPQSLFPVPEGILNHHGLNYIALSLWSFDAAGNKLAGLSLVPTAQIMSGIGPVTLSPMPAWAPRPGAY